MLRDGSLECVLSQYHQSADVWAVPTARLDHSAKLRMCTELLISKLQSGPCSLDPRWCTFFIVSSACLFTDFMADGLLLPHP